MTICGHLILAISAALPAACVAADPTLTPASVPTNGPAACYAGASWIPQEERVSHSWQSSTMPMGEALACDLAKRELAVRSPGICQTSFGSRTDIRNLTARTQFDGGSWICTCRDAGIFMQCDVEGDAICNFESAAAGTDSCR